MKMKNRLMEQVAGLEAVLFCLMAPLALSAGVVINEVQSGNDQTILDEYGEDADWVELYNDGDEAVDLSGWGLSDKATKPYKWTFPAGTSMEPGAYLLVFCSGVAKEGAQLHSSLSLSASGETLTLTDTAGTTADTFTFGALPAETSFGRVDLGGGMVTNKWFATPTPGTENNQTAYEEPLGPVVFSKERGVFTGSTAFDVTLTHPDPEATIWYTLDHSDPTNTTTAIEYKGESIHVSGTTIIRATAMREGHLPYRNIVSQSYLYLDQIVNQQKPDVAPTTWTDLKKDSTTQQGSCTASYTVSTTVLTDDAKKAAFLEALGQAPVISVTLSDDDLFNPDTGIYCKPVTLDGTKRAASVEWVTGNHVFCTDAGLCAHGGASRHFEYTPKKSFGLKFRGRFGASKLDQPIFDDIGNTQDEFKSLVLRAESNHSWTHIDAPDKGTSMHDQFLRDLFGAMTGVQSHGNQAHLFINGLYWGLYNVVEALDDHFAAINWGGENEEYDVVVGDRHDDTGMEIRDGDGTNYVALVSELKALAATDVRAMYETADAKIDLDMMIDYMTLEWFVGNKDWPQKNWTAMMSVSRGVPLRYVAWDLDQSMIDVSYNRVSYDNVAEYPTTTNSVQVVQRTLENSPEYKLRFADHIHKHFYNDGVLTVAALTNRYATMADRIRPMVFAEVARWGAYRKDYENKTLYDMTTWDKEYSRLTGTYFPKRWDNFKTQLKNQGLYPSVEAPEFTVSADRKTATLSVPTGATVYYTTDGSDPREAYTGNAVGKPYTAGAAVEALGTKPVKARALKGTEWSALSEVALVPSRNAFLPTTNGENWDSAANWSYGFYPNAPGAEAAIGVPTKVKKDKGWRNVKIDTNDVTVGWLEVENGGWTNRISTGSFGNLTFCGADDGEGKTNATLLVKDTANAGLTIIDLDAPNMICLGSDTTVVVSNTVGDVNYGGLLLKGAFAGNGHDLKKSGPGRMTIAFTNAADTAAIGKLQCDEGVVAVETPIRVGSITKSGELWVRAGAADAEGALVVSDGKCNAAVKLFVPATDVGQTLFGGVAATEFKVAPEVYVPSAVGKVTFGEQTWVACADAEVTQVATGDGKLTYQVTVNSLEPPGVLRVSEICPKPQMACRTDANKLTDATDPNGVVAGWIELENAGEYPVNLGSYELQVVNRGKKAKAGAYPNLPEKILQPGERAVVYTTKGYVKGGDLMFAEPLMEKDSVALLTAGSAAGIVADEIVLSTKVSPKKFQMVRLLKGANVIDTVVLPADLPDNASVVVADPGTDGNGVTLRYLTMHPTCGTANDLTGAVKLGPEVGPLYGVKHSLTNLDPVAPATAGQDYPITLDVNPVDAANAKDAIQSVTLVYRTDVNATTYERLPMTNGETDELHGARWTASVPSGKLPAKGMLLQWKAEIVDAAGNTWTSPAFNNKDAGYEWYGTIVDPGVGDGDGQNSPNHPTWHMFAITGEKNTKTTSSWSGSTTTTYWMTDLPGKSSTRGDKCMMNLDYDEVFEDPATTNNLKVWKEFYPYGARVAIYDAETSNYYDNVRIDCRGNSSDDYYKRSHGLKFSKIKAYRLATPYVHPVSGEEIDEISKTSICAEFNDPAQFRQRLAFWFMNTVGVHAPWENPKRVNLNGQFYQFAYESPRFTDELLCDVYGFDARGYGYKNVGSLHAWSKDDYGYTMGTSASAGTKTKTPDDGNEKDFTVLTNFFAEIAAAGNVESDKSGTSAKGLDDAALTAKVVEKFDLPAWINYLAATRITQEGDDAWGNLSAYYDNAELLDGTVRGTGTWRPLPWDMNCSWGQYYTVHLTNPSRTGPVANQDWNKCHPFYGGKRILGYKTSAATDSYYGADGANFGFESVFQSTKFRRLFLRRLRTLMDEYLKAPDTAAADTPIAVQMQTYADEILAESRKDRGVWGPLGQTSGNKDCDWVNCWGTSMMPSGNQPNDPADGVTDIWNKYIVPRRTHLYETHAAGSGKTTGYGLNVCAGIPGRQADVLSLRDRISTRYDADLGAVVIENRNAETIDVSGWKLTGPVEMTLPPGTVLDQGTDATPGEVYVTADRRATIAAMSLTDQVVVGNGAAGDAAAFPRLSDAGGTPVYPLTVSVSVSIKKGKGTYTGDGEYDFGSDVTLTATPATGYHFTKWKDTSSGAEHADNPLVFSNLTSSLALTVNMPANKHTVVYDPNGGSGEIEAGEATYDTHYETAACTFAKTGYACTGWGTNGVDGIVLVCAPGEKVLNLTAEDDGEVTLYAMWEPIGYVLSYAPGEAVGVATNVSLAYDAGHVVLANPFAWEDHEFVGWLEGETLHQPGEIVSNLTAEAGATVVFTAQWEEVSPVPEDDPEKTEDLTLNVGETVVLTNHCRMNPRFWLLGTRQRDRLVAATLNVPAGPVTGVIGYRTRSVATTNAVTVTITGVAPGEEEVSVGRQYKRKAPVHATHYRVIVK